MGTNVVSPMSAMLDSNVTALADATGRWLHNAKDTMGFTVRRSSSTKAAAATQNTPAATVTAVFDEPTSVSAISRAVTAMVKVLAPAMSMARRSCLALSWKKTMKPPAASRPMGMFIQKTQAHDAWRIISAPMMGPSTADMAQTLAK